MSTAAPQYRTKTRRPDTHQVDIVMCNTITPDQLRRYAESIGEKAINGNYVIDGVTIRALAEGIVATGLDTDARRTVDEIKYFLEHTQVKENDRSNDIA